MKSYPESNRPWSEKELVDLIKTGHFEFPPARLRFRRVASSLGVDGGIVAKWREHSALYAFDYKPSSSRKSIDELISRLPNCLQGKQEHLPLVIVPYLSDEALLKLEDANVSGLDLCGNGCLMAPNFAITRSGRPNRFVEPQPLRNVFRGTSSIITRCFLLREQFSTLVELRDFALRRLPHPDDSILAKGTVSKVVQVLEEDKIIARSGAGLWLCSRSELLDKLQHNHRRNLRVSFQGKSPLDIKSIWERLAESPLRYTATGLTSAGQYKVLSQSDQFTIYVNDSKLAIELLQAKPTALFPNVEIIEEKSPLVYFDARNDGPRVWASPIQTWLELSTAGSREKAAADELKSGLLEQTDGEL